VPSNQKVLVSIKEEDKVSQIEPRPETAISAILSNRQIKESNLKFNN
jgi:hypothetical protein